MNISFAMQVHSHATFLMNMTLAETYGFAKMQSGEPQDYILNQLEAGDPDRAWGCLRRLIEGQEPLPGWARTYFLKLAAAMDDFDPAEDDALVLLRILGVKHSPKMPARKRKSKVDYPEIYRSVSDGRMKGLTVEDSINAYIRHKGLPDDLATFDTVKSAYNSVRRERVDALEQLPPNYQRPRT